MPGLTTGLNGHESAEALSPFDSMDFIERHKVSTTQESATSASASSAATAVSTPRSLRWRVVDIAVASVVGVVSAFIFWAAVFVYDFLFGPLEGALPGLSGLLNGLWLFAGPLALIIVRKPGAAIYAEIVASVLEALMGNEWGAATLYIGFIQGLFAELAFLFFAYKVWNLAVTTLSGTLAGLGCWGYSFFTHLQAINWNGSYGLANLVTTLISGALLSGIAMWYLARGLGRTGALDQFASGREVHKA